VGGKQPGVNTKKLARKAPKKKASGKVVAKPRALPYFVHPKGMADSDTIGQGTRIWAHAHVMKGARVGAHCNIGECSFIETGAVLGNHVTIKNGVQIWDKVTCEDYVFCGPNSTFTNDMRPRVAFPVDPASFAKTLLKYGTSIGANATIVAGTVLGPHALVGAGTVVIRDVPAHALVVGNPARQIGWVCACGVNLDADLACPSCHKRFERDGAGLKPAA
jgi:UDP-2-acetamido-3-amino-2,3-dideoxy-glucuronate N-acetyltransferase